MCTFEVSRSPVVLAFFLGLSLISVVAGQAVCHLLARPRDNSGNSGVR